MKHYVLFNQVFVLLEYFINYVLILIFSSVATNSSNVKNPKQSENNFY